MCPMSLALSNSSIEHGWIFLNVHSCKPFDKAVVIETVKEYFDVQTITDKFMYRRA